MTAPSTVVVAMSGGVDSAVAAHLLHAAGHDVIGVTMKLFCYGDTPAGPRSCCSIDAIEDARASCDRIGISHYLVNLEEHFAEKVIDPFVREYLSGETPNPCVLCNQHVKFDPLLAKARAFGADRVATGHHARLEQGVGGPRLRRGADLEKDQSYALWSVRRKTLARTMMPVGEHSKREIREIATAARLPVADKIDSQDICFVPDGDYARVVAERTAPGTGVLSPGPIVDMSGERIGTHAGVARFTIGQRRGIGVAAPEPMYVVGLDAPSNTLTVGPREALAARAFLASDVNWVSIDEFAAPRSLTVQVRYRHAGVRARVEPAGTDRVRATFEEPVDAVTPGQSAVFYDGDVVLGGGVIATVERW